MENLREKDKEKEGRKKKKTFNRAYLIIMYIVVMDDLHVHTM